MADMIVPSEISGGSIYGVVQMQYAIDGVDGKNFIDAVTIASFKQADAIETAAGAYVAVVRARQQKITDLGKVLAEFSKAIGRMKQKGGKSTDKAKLDNYQMVVSILNKYEISVSNLSSEMERGDLMKGETTVQYEIDKEDNNLQQDIVSMQSFLTKRDNAFSTAAKLVSKANNAATSTIHNIGD